MTPAPTDDPTRNAIGINVYATLDWARNRPFTDLMKTARAFTAIGSDSTPVPTDANGWPTTDFQVIVFADLGRQNGTHALSFEGKADVQAAGGTIQGLTYDEKTNTTTAQLVIADENTSNLSLAFRGTQGGVKNIRLMRPVAPGSTKSYEPTQVFTDQFLALIDAFPVIRVMDWLATNSNGQVNWSDRVLPSYASSNRMDPNYGWQGHGTAWEYAIMLANLTGKDLWICVPGEATEDYVRELAKLFKNGSTVDGVKYPGLRSDLHVYIENSNEVWNTFGGFQQSLRNHAAAVSELSAGNSPLAFDGTPDSWIAAWRRVAYRAARISMIFREVFGDSAMMTRIRPVLPWQQNDGQATGSTELDFIDRYFGTVHAGNPEAHPVSWFFWGGGGSAYYGPDNGSNSLTIDNIWKSGTFDVAAWREVLRRDAMLTIAHGIRRVAYEGGPSLDGTASAAAKSAAVADPRMTQLIVDLHDEWSRMNGDLLVYYCDAGPTYEWPFTYDALDLDTAKLRAIEEIASRPRPEPTIGNTAPHTYAGGDFDYVYPEWLSSQVAGQAQVHVDASRGDWFLYVVRTTSKTKVDVVVSHANGAAGAGAELRLDGVTQEVLDVGGAAAGSTAPVTLELSPGVHGIVLRATAGTFDLSQVAVTPH